MKVSEISEVYYDMLLIDMKKLVRNTRKILIKIMNHHVKNNLKYWDANNLYGSAMSQKLPLGGFKWVEETSRFNESFMNIYNEDSNIKGYFIEAAVQHPEKLHEPHNDLHFCLIE